MSKYLCEFCDHKLSTEVNLKKHQQTAKYCLKAQGKVISSAFTCEYCDKKFTQKSNLQFHAKSCKQRPSETEKLKDENAALRAKISRLETHNKKIVAREKLKDKRIQELERKVSYGEGKIDGQSETYEKVANKPMNVYINPKLVNISIDNIRPMTVGTIREDVHKYTYEEFLRGLDGLEQFIEGIIVDDKERNYVCVDSSRNKFHRLLESREWKADNCAHFINTILDELKEVATEHLQTLVDAERDAVSDVFRREEIEQQRIIAKPVYYGITSSGGDRERLFKSVRNRIRDVAAV